MRISNRLLERRLSTAFVLASLAAVGAAAASCSSDGDAGQGPETSDAAIGDARASDSPVGDADAGTPKQPLRDAETSDAAPRPVVCASPPCATTLATTVGRTSTASGFCALLQDKTVACWGQNLDGQLGRGPDAGSTDSAWPRRVEGLSDIAYLEHGCAIDASGSTWCWGTGAFLRSTTVAFTKETIPVKLAIPPATKIAVGRYANDLAVGCAVVASGVICWGTNGSGQVGVPEAGVSATAALAPREIPMPPGAPIESLSVGYASIVLRADGTALSWGASPPLGRVSSLFPDPYPRPIALAGLSSVDVFNENACAVAQGIAYCWGSKEGSAPTGNHDDLARALPWPVGTPEPVVDIATNTSLGNLSLSMRWCAVGVSGAVYCWGNNTDGQAGDGTHDYAFEPVKVAGLPAPAARVKVTGRSTCALLTTGKVYCWGDNVNGQLGNGAIDEPSSVPLEVVLP